LATWRDFLWADEATEATVTIVVGHDGDPKTLLRRLGPAEDAGPMTFADALELQGSFYDDGTFDERAVFQVDRLVPSRRECWGLVEPNGFRLSLEALLLTLAQERLATSFFWNINALMSLVRVEHGKLLSMFDPLVDVEQAKEQADDLPFGVHHARAASFALIERWTGVVITEPWFLGAKPTFVVQTPNA
jgi:hypothetical protein